MQQYISFRNRLCSGCRRTGSCLRVSTQAVRSGHVFRAATEGKRALPLLVDSGRCSQTCFITSTRLKLPLLHILKITASPYRHLPPSLGQLKFPPSTCWLLAWQCLRPLKRLSHFSNQHTNSFSFRFLLFITFTNFNLISHQLRTVPVWNKCTTYFQHKLFAYYTAKFLSNHFN